MFLYKWGNFSPIILDVKSWGNALVLNIEFGFGMMLMSDVHFDLVMFLFGASPLSIPHALGLAFYNV